MPEGTYNHPLFGLVRFKTANQKWIYGDDITFISGFDPSVITDVTIPELRNITGSHHGVLKFHEKGHKQLQAAFQQIKNDGLTHHIHTCGGTLNMRLRRPISGKLSRLPSNHAFGTAIDLNEDDGSNGGSVAPVAPVFRTHGFTWGKSFNDPMHFEIKSFLT
jgi:hypothetical protein